MVRHFLLVTLLALGCGPKPASTSTGPAQGSSAAVGSGSAEAASSVTVGLGLKITPSDAVVEIDGIRFGLASTLDPVFALEPGIHTLVITRAQYKPYRIEFSITDKVEQFDVTLERAK